MNDIQFDIAAHWLPVEEKQGSVDKDTLRIKVAGINFYTKPEAESWGFFIGSIRPEPDNPYDANAIAFYNSEGKVLGHVQKELQDYVTQFTKGRELDCIIAITPFISKRNEVCNQAYATILKFFENDIEYAAETINSITEIVGNDVSIELTHFERKISTNGMSQPTIKDDDDNEEEGYTIFRYNEFYKFPQSEKTGKSTYDTLTIKIEDADWYFDRKKWPAGVFSGYLDIVHLESNHKYGVFRDDNSLVGCPNSFDFDDVIEEFVEGKRVYCIFSLIPHIDSRTSCIDIKGKAVLIKFFESEEDYAHKLYETTRTRLARVAVADYKRFMEKKEELESIDVSVLLSWSFDSRRYSFGDKGTTYLDDHEKPRNPRGGCASLFVLSFVILFFLLL